MPAKRERCRFNRGVFLVGRIAGLGADLEGERHIIYGFGFRARAHHCFWSQSLVPLERLAVIRTNVHPLDLPDWHTCAQNVLDTTAVSVRLSSTFRDDRMVGITCTSCIRDVARFEAAKGIVERYFAERQRPEGPPSFSPWGIDGEFLTDDRRGKYPGADFHTR